MGRPTDPAIEEIEAQLRESRLKAWDVETFLAKRHQAKIEALTAPTNNWRKWRQIGREAATAISSLVGYVTIATLAGGWLLTGEPPLQRGASDPPVIITPIPPVPDCPLPETTQQ